MSSRAVTTLGYVFFLVVALALQVLARRPGSRIPTLGSATRWAMRSRPGRVAIIAGWAWVGLHFFAR